ncbi:MAG: alpha/beta fold hydrolase [Chitinophagaceae bacterium]
MDSDATKITLYCSDGYELDGLLFEPTGPARAVVLMQGGTGIKKEFYSNFCDFLRQQGFVVISYDYRGIGGSRHGSLRGMNASLMDWAQLDMKAAIAFGEKRYPDLPMLLVGHSIGTQLIGFTPNNDRLKLVIGIASSTGTWWKMKWPGNMRSFVLWYIIHPVLTPFFGYAPLKRLRIMEDLPRRVIGQWSRWCRSSFYFGSHIGQSIPQEDFHPLKVPFIVHYFKDDTIANDQTVTDLTSIYRGTRIRMIKHRPKDYHLKKVGHSGMFSRRFKNSFWTRIAEEAGRYL